MADSLVLAGLYELIGGTDNPEYRLAPGSDFGEPQPDQTVIPGVLLSGDRVAGRRSGNRTTTFTVHVTGSDRTVMAANVNKLLTVIDAQNDESFTLTRTPDGGLPVIYDCSRGRWSRPKILTQEQQLVTQVTLTCQASPFGRSDAPVTVAAASPQLQVDSMNTAPTNATLDTSLKYEGTGSASVALTRNSHVGAGGRTYYNYTSPTVSHTITSVDLSAHASLGTRFYWPAPTVGAPWLATVTLTLSDGTRSAQAFASVSRAAASTVWTLLSFSLTGMTISGGGALPNMAAITSWKLDLSTESKALSIPPTTSTSVHYDDLRAFPSSSSAVSTTEGAVVTVPAVIGTAPAPVALTVTRSPMTSLFLHRPPVWQSLDAQILAALTGTPKTVTIPSTGNTFEGTYSVVLIATTVGSGTRTVSVQFDHKQGATTLATYTTIPVTYTGLTGKFLIAGEVTLPIVPVPAENNSDTLVITVNASGGTGDIFASVALADTQGQVLMLGVLPTGTTVVYVDEPDPIAELGQVYASATDRTAATGQLGWGTATRVDGGPIVLEPGDNRILAASADGLPSVTASYSPRWLDERTV